MIKLIRKNYHLLFFFLFFLLASIIYFWPFLKHPAFNLIDDGVSLKVSREILIENNLTSLIEVKNGRMRPLYWLYFAFIYLFSDTDPLGMWVGQMLVFTLTLFPIWYLLSSFFKTNRWGKYIIALLLLTLFFVPAISANLYRLGTAEVKQMMLVVWFMVWLKNSLEKKSKPWVGFLLFASAFFSKETSILLMPMIFAFFTPFILSNYKKHENKICLLLFFFSFSLVFYSLIGAMRESSSYATNFSVSFSQIKTNLYSSVATMSEIYYLLLGLISLAIIRFVFLATKNKTKIENHLFTIILKFWKENSLLVSNLVGLITSLFLIFSWQHQFERYYYPVYIFLFIAIALELEKSTQLFKKQNSKNKALILFLPILLSLASYTILFKKLPPQPKNYLIANSKIKRLWYSDYQNSYSIINALLLEKTDKIYTLIDDYEVVYELALFANKLNPQENQVVLISPNKEITIKGSHLKHEENIEEAFLADQAENVILVTIDSRDLNLDDKLYNREVLTNSFLEKYSDRPNWVIWRRGS